MTRETIGAEGADAPGEAEAPVFDTLVQMTLNAFERSGLDPETYLLTRIAALVAMSASPASYLLNVGAADEIGVPVEKIRGTLVAIAPRRRQRPRGDRRLRHRRCLRAAPAARIGAARRRRGRRSVT
ncbi:hypothetical protein WKI71_22255 [Streptomyces sp. MS1.AVA.1]|uniref:Carboxymuconolactone decarboxylase family protein n=1 Tax=Streptomyces machairae TaxID=3134109 RepID=A0ABU8UMK7_9ACTN